MDCVVFKIPVGLVISDHFCQSKISRRKFSPSLVEDMCNVNHESSAEHSEPARKYSAHKVKTE